MPLGQLLVELAVNSARMQGGFDSARSMAQRFSNDLKSSFNQLGNSFSQLGASVGASFGPLGGIISGVTQGIGAMGEAFKSASFGAETFKIASVGALGLAGAALAAAAGFMKLSSEGARVTEELERSALKLGVTTTQMAGLKAAAEFVDVPVKTLTRGFAQFAKVLGDLDNPTSKSAALLRSMGVTAGSGTYEGLVKATDAISHMQDPVQRMNAATQLFGRRIGLELLPMLSDTTYGLQHFADMARESGVSIDENGIKRSKEWKDANDRLAMSWDGVKIKAFDTNSSMIEATNILSRFINVATDEGTWDLIRDNAAIFSNLTMHGEIKLSSSVSKEHGEKETDPQRAAKEAAAKEAEKQVAAENKLVAAAKLAADQFDSQTKNERDLVAAQEDERVLIENINTLHTGTALDIAKSKEEMWGQVKATRENIAAIQARIDLEKNAQRDTNKFLDETKRLTSETQSKIGGAEGETKEQREIVGIKDLLDKWKQYAVDYPKAIAIANGHVRELEKELTSLTADEAHKRALLESGVIPGYKAVSKEINETISEKQKEAEAWVAAAEREHNADAQQEADMAKLEVQARAQQSAFGRGMKGGDQSKEKEKAQLEESQALTKIQIDEINNYEKWLDKNNPKDLEKLRNYEKQKEKIIKEGANKETKIKEDALLEQEQKTREAEDRMAHAVASAAAKNIVSGQDMGKAFKQLGQQMLETALTNFMQMEALDGRKKLKDASKAARGAFTGVMDMNLPPFIGFPLAIASGAAAFAGVMAFEKGGIVPETGLVKLHEKEMVLPRPIAEKVQAMADPSSSHRNKRATTVNMTINTPNANSFMFSQKQIQAKAHASAQKMAKRNGA